MRALVVWLLSVALLSGCGSSGSGGGGGEAASAPGQVIAGRVELDVPWAGATVQAQLPDGTVVQQGQTDENGTFALRLETVPPALRLVASGRPPGALGEEAYALDYRPDRPSIINPLTNLYVAYRDSHPEIPADEAREKLRRFFGMTGQEQLETHMVYHGLRPGFAVLRYLAQARSRSRQTAYVTSLVDHIHQGKSAFGVGLSNAPKWESTAAVVGTTTLQLIVGIIKGNQYAAPLAALTGWVLGSVLDLNNPNKEILGDLNVIIGQLNDVLQDLTSLQNSIQQLGLQTLQEELNTDTSAINTTVFSFLTVANATNAASTANTIFAADLPTHTDHIHSSLAPGPGGNYLLLAAANLSTALEPNGYQLAGGMHSNASWSNQLAALYNYYANYQSQAAQMLVEAYHSLPVPGLARALAHYDRFCEQVALQRSLTPRAFDSDRVLYQPATGLLFYSVIQYPATYREALARAEGFREAGYIKWRLMTLSDVNNWILGAPSGDGPNAANGNAAISLADLQAMGFDTTHVGMDGTQPWFGVDDHGSVGPEAWYLGSGGSPGVGGNVAQPDGPWSEERGDPRYDSHRYYARYPYILVCDAADQAPELIPALGNLTSLQASASPFPGGAQLSATGVYTLNKPDQASYSSTSVTRNGPDITPYVSWSCSFPSAARVQNYPLGSVPAPDFGSFPLPAGYNGPFGAGLVTFYNAFNGTPVTFTATSGSRSAAASLLTANVNLVSQAVPPQLQALRVAPRNQVMNTQGPLNLTATGYYSDGTTQDLSPLVTWSLQPASAGNILVQPPFVQLTLSNSTVGANPFNLTVSAANGSLTDSMNVVVNLP